MGEIPHPLLVHATGVVGVRTGSGVVTAPDEDQEHSRPDAGWTGGRRPGIPPGQRPSSVFKDIVLLAYQGSRTTLQVPRHPGSGTTDERSGSRWIDRYLRWNYPQGPCTLASTSRAQRPIRRDTALRWPNTRLEAPRRGRSPHTGRAGGPGTVIAMDMTGPGDAQASVRDPIAHRRGAEAASPAVPEATSVAGRAPSPGRGVPVPCSGGRMVHCR